MSRQTVVCGVKSCDRNGQCTESCVCIGCIQPIPIFPSINTASARNDNKEKGMTTEQKIAYLTDLRNKDRDAEPIPGKTRVNLEKPFDLAGQFTSSTVAAVMARNAEVRPESPRTPTKVLGAFNPRLFGPVAVHALFPSRGADDFSDDRSNADDDDDIGSASLGVAADLLNCRIAGHEGTSECVHKGGDHVDLARQCLERYSREEAARKQRRASVGQNVVGIRFA
jgi:hypothetical protein